VLGIDAHQDDAEVGPRRGRQLALDPPQVGNEQGAGVAAGRVSRSSAKTPTFSVVALAVAA
jgi:hypothetical protein